MRRLLLLLLPLLLVPAVSAALAACGDGDEVAPTGETTADGGGHAGTATGEEPELPGGELVRCESPAGFVLGRPASWSTNPGEVVPACSQLHPEPFEVPEGTDERVAALTAFIDPVPFAEVAAAEPAREAERAPTAIDGLQAVRLEYETDGGGLWPEGTQITLYAIDLAPEPDDEPRTLFLDTVGLEGFEYETNRIVLDRVARSVEVTLDGVPTAEAVVARYAGGGGGLTVEAEAAAGEACLRIPPRGEPVCTALPAADQAHTVQLTDLEPVLAGVTGSDVFRITAERRDGEPSVYLPAPIPGVDAGGFAFTFGLDAVTRLVLTDLTGTELHTIEPGG